MAKVQTTNVGVRYNSLTNQSRITGKIVAENDFRIDGEIEGGITCSAKVVVGVEGYLKGNILCVNAEIFGKVDGDITASESVSLRSTASIKSNVIAKMIMIEPHAVFNGTCSIKKHETAVLAY